MSLVVLNDASNATGVPDLVFQWAQYLERVIKQYLLTLCNVRCRDIYLWGLSTKVG